MNNTEVLKVPDLGIELRHGDIIRLGQFKTREWKVGFGWYKFGGNREISGWYITSTDAEQEVRPIQKVDLLDIVMVSHAAQ